MQLCGVIENPIKLLFQVTLSPAEELLNIVGGIRNKVANWPILFLLQCSSDLLLGATCWTREPHLVLGLMTLYTLDRAPYQLSYQMCIYRVRATGASTNTT